MRSWLCYTSAQPYAADHIDATRPAKISGSFLAKSGATKMTNHFLFYVPISTVLNPKRWETVHLRGRYFFNIAKVFPIKLSIITVSNQIEKLPLPRWHYALFNSWSNKNDTSVSMLTDPIRHLRLHSSVYRAIAKCSWNFALLHIRVPCMLANREEVWFQIEIILISNSKGNALDNICLLIYRISNATQLFCEMALRPLYQLSVPTESVMSPSSSRMAEYMRINVWLVVIWSIHTYPSPGVTL